MGFGAEIGISTHTLHARGPMRLPGLTTYVLTGDGHARGGPIPIGSRWCASVAYGRERAAGAAGATGALALARLGGVRTRGGGRERGSGNGGQAAGVRRARSMMAA